MSEATHLGTGGSDRGAYAAAYVRGRLGVVEKDVTICLTAAPLEGTSRSTHAYFPALGTCCAFLEHLACLLRGKVDGHGHPDASAFALRFMRQPDYAPEVVRILFRMFRDPVAHMGVANGILLDGRGATIRRLTWKVSADARYPGCEVIEERGELVHHPPWPCRYTHRVQVRLKRLLIDLRDGANAYAEALPADPQLLDRFYRVMDRLFPR